MTCFIAMKIGDPETDAVYLKLIRPALRQAKVAPIRSDKVVHNSRVDQWIERQLDRCDVVVADLTFARPSVYWEAGRAEGADLPVIYTCRRDHFRPPPDDEHGNFRIHFDLHTKNIIEWSSPTDRRFPGRLRARLRHVLAPLKRKRADEAETQAEIAAFARRPMRERRRALLKIATTVGEATGFRDPTPREERNAIRSVYERTRLEGTWSGARIARHAIQSVFLNVLDRDPGSIMKQVEFVSHLGPIRHDLHDVAERRGIALEEHRVVMTLGKVVPRSLDRWVPDFTPTTMTRLRCG